MQQPNPQRTIWANRDDHVHKPRDEGGAGVGVRRAPVRAVEKGNQADVVAEVSFALELLLVPLSERQHRRHVPHHLDAVLTPNRVKRVFSGRPVCTAMEWGVG